MQNTIMWRLIRNRIPHLPSYIVNWLSQQGVDFNYSDSWNKLLHLTKTVNHEKLYVVDETVMKHGHFLFVNPPIIPT